MRLLDPINDGLLGEKIQKSATEGMEAPLLDSNDQVWTVRGAKEIEKSSNKFLPEVVLTASVKVQARGIEGIETDTRRC